MVVSRVILGSAASESRDRTDRVAEIANDGKDPEDPWVSTTPVASEQVDR